MEAVAGPDKERRPEDHDGANHEDQVIIKPANLHFVSFLFVTFGVRRHGGNEARSDDSLGWLEQWMRVKRGSKASNCNINERVLPPGQDQRVTT